MTFKLLAKTVTSVAAILALSACGGSDTQSTPSTSTTQAASTKEATKAAESTAGHNDAAAPSAVLDRVLASAHRADDQPRDAWRHPKETLNFFGVTPDLKVAELFPGGGWYTRVLAPYMAAGDGTYVAVNFNPGTNERRVAGLNTFKERFSDESVYGKVEHGLIGGGATMAEAGSLDVVLTFRNVHNWMAGDVSDQFFKEFYDALKPGGVLGLVEHRGDEATEQDPRARTGYVNESTAIAFAEKAGFVLEARSDINANPKDTRDHPFGVWTLPPVKRSAQRGETNENFDRSKFDAIGESDRMTLKFRKPLDGDAALLE